LVQPAWSKVGRQVRFIGFLQDLAGKPKGRGTMRIIFFIEFFDTGMKQHWKWEGSDSRK
jgi:hypothetical protein